MKAGWIETLGRLAAAGVLFAGATLRAQTGAAVHEVRIRTEDGRTMSAPHGGITVETGKPLDRGKVAESIRALYKGGEYRNVRAVAVETPEGLRVDFVVEENLFFNEVLIEGLKAPPSEASAAAAMQITLGTVYRKDALDEAVERLRTVLRDEGLYQAKVSAETVPHPETHQMDIVVHVVSGPRARTGDVELINHTEYPREQLLERLRMKTGREITTARIQGGTERIRKFLAKKKHLSSRAAVRRGDYDAASNSVPLTLEVTEGPRVEVEVVGAKFSGSELKRLLPIYQEGAVDADLLEEGKRNLRERLERNGFFDASVEYQTAVRESKQKNAQYQGTAEVITYTVTRGDRHKLVDIEVSGNKYFNTELLKSRLQIYRGAFASRGRFSRKLMESDRQSMQLLYQSNGFLDATVDAQIMDDYEKHTGDLLIRFVVNEGRQTRVASLAIDGLAALKEENLVGYLASIAGQPYSDYNVTADRDNILAIYFNEGFPEARFSVTATPVAAEEKKEGDGTDHSASIALVYHVVEGPQTRVRRILISGHKHTRQRVVRREIEVKPGEPLRQGEVVDSQRRLYNLGVFNRVTIEPQNSAGTNPDKDIAVLVEEAKRYTVSYGGGFEVQRLASTNDPTKGQVQAAPRGILELTKLNLTGRADSLSLKLRGSTLQGRALLGYSAPDTFGSPRFSFQATAFVEKTRDINTFTETRYEGSVQLTDQITPRTTLLYRYAFRKVLVSNLKITQDEIPLFQQPTLVSQFSVSWFRDARNNPADATKGSFNSADFGIADTGIGSSASFLRLVLQNSTYHPIKRRFSFARSMRIGLLEPYRDTVSLSFPAPTTAPLPTVIPLPERFFGGGGTSLRGFGLNQAGPRDALTGFPVGGQALLVLNQEFRFPMRLPFFGTQLGGAFFYDGGNVYSRLSRISFRTSTPKPVFDSGTPPQCVANCSNELNYFAHTIGIGVRYGTPVGPIRVDLGYQLNRPFFVIPIPCPGGSTACTPGSLGFRSTQLPRLQIFFNLGSSF